MCHDCGYVSPWTDSGDRGLDLDHHKRNDCPSATTETQEVTMAKYSTANPADPILGPFQEKMRGELLKYLVGRIMHCARTGEVLDFRTCVVFVDTDGDPSYAISQRAWREVSEQYGGSDEAAAKMARVGQFLDRSTFKGA